MSPWLTLEQALGAPGLRVAPVRCGHGLNDALVAGELLSTTDVDRLSRFYLGVYQGIAIQARDGATSAELKGVAETAMAAWPGIKANRKRRA
jgi:hypothetical protein